MDRIRNTANIVIVANDVNLSIFKPDWLVKVGIFEQEELHGAVVLTPLTANIPTKDFVLTVLPNRIQCDILPGNKQPAKTINRVVAGIVQTLPHTPYTAVGLNFVYAVRPDEDRHFVGWISKYFGSAFTHNLGYTEGNNPLYGSYVSFDVLGMRLKLTMVPTEIKTIGPAAPAHWKIGELFLQTSLNFHCDVTGETDPAKAVVEALAKWDLASGLAEEIIQLLDE